MSNVQAVILGFSPSDHELERLEGIHKFALHHYAARKLAERDILSLKEAFTKLGPWNSLRLKDDDDIGDFFNLLNHRHTITIE
jgi:hypothetical protein